MNPFAVNAAINSLSFGNVSIAILREMYKRGLSPSLFPIAADPRNPLDLSTQKDDPAFTQWLNGCHAASQQRHARKNATIRLWHIGDSLTSYSDRGNNLITFFELDQLTPVELNILRQQKLVYVTSSYTQSVFNQFGCATVYLPLGFDAHNFSTLPVRPHIDSVTSFLMVGKLEKRKGHFQVLKAWAKRYGNNKAYALNCSVHNPFLPPEAQQQLVAQALEGKSYWNINFVPWAENNATYNSTLQSSDIVLCMSGGEGRDLPCYHATALGAWPVAMRAHAYLDYLTDENAVLVNPNGKQPATDGIFFHANQPFNQGNVFTFDDNEFITACEVAESRVKSLGVNKKGMELQQQTYATAVDTLLRDV